MTDPQDDPGPPDPAYVDPRDVAAVARVLTAVAGTDGLGAVLDLLARLPGVHVDPGRPARLLRPAVPGCTWLGGQDRFALVDGPLGPRLEHQQVVGGVTLARDLLGADRVGAVLARLVGPAVAATGPAGVQEATALLSAYADLHR